MNVWKVFITVLMKRRSVLTLLEVLNVNVLQDTRERMEYAMVCNLSIIQKCFDIIFFRLYLNINKSHTRHVFSFAVTYKSVD